MHVGDEPLSIDLAQTGRLPPPHVDFISIRARAADMVKAVPVGRRFTRSDLDLLLVIRDRAVEGGKPLLRPLENLLGAVVLQKLNQVKSDQVFRIQSAERLGILVAARSGHLIQHRPYRLIVTGGILLTAKKDIHVPNLSVGVEGEGLGIRKARAIPSFAGVSHEHPSVRLGHMLDLEMDVIATVWPAAFEILLPINVVIQGAAKGEVVGQDRLNGCPVFVFVSLITFSHEISGGTHSRAATG